VRFVRHPLPGRALFGAAAVVRRPRLDRLLGRIDVLWAPAPAPLAASPGVPLVLTVHDRSFEVRPATSRATSPCGTGSRGPARSRPAPTPSSATPTRSGRTSRGRGERAPPPSPRLRCTVPSAAELRPEARVVHHGGHATGPALRDRAVAMQARRRRGVIAAHLGPGALALDDAAQALTFGARALVGRRRDRKVAELRALLRTRRG
jgi:hypothetical protein